MASTAITPTTLESDTFAREVLENGLAVTGPYQGWYYALKRTSAGNVLYRTSRYHKVWEYQVTLQQTNAAGGAVVWQVQMPANVSGRLMAWRVSNSGNNTIQVLVLNSNAEGWYLNNISAAAGISAAGPQTLANSGTSGTIVSSQPDDARTIPERGYLRILQTGAGVQNDTLKIWFYMELCAEPSTVTPPTPSTAGSTNPSDVTTTTVVNEIRKVLVI